ncbi:hypothetical protein FISHEDRAFT_46310 [Fistulina hepatica ATCC 64428]|uniref:Mitochondrial distribution and morphology protein 12 n=1 Tax=Fistulina hepatica ATCC 64428 TaxID=1128425 RepID=A0A0D7AAI9_9AGAR|nr:hypothetical protein FISHEDRAFT_46310 [Fistulina hepatica ATCC 64428]
MSIDLDWDKLDNSLAVYLVDALNHQLSLTTRPSFVGPVHVTSLDFGTNPPDIELVDMRDIYRDFVDDEEEDESAPRRPDQEDDFEWVSRKAAQQGDPGAPYHQLPVQARYGTASNPVLGHPPMEVWAAGMEPPPPIPSAQPNVQLHLYVTWRSNMRITLTTSLHINYPSPSFMSLPIKLSVTGLVFNGELVVAYEGARQRIHLCILDDLDPYGPSTAAKRDVRERECGDAETPPEGTMDDIIDSAAAGYAYPSQSGYPTKPLPVGQRLFPSIFIESEIGQADKHVLKNVTRVERFIQDVVRKTVEEELVFPNFHTMLIGDQ